MDFIFAGVTSVVVLVGSYFPEHAYLFGVILGATFLLFCICVWVRLKKGGHSD